MPNWHESTFSGICFAILVIALVTLWRRARKRRTSFLDQLNYQLVAMSYKLKIMWAILMSQGLQWPGMIVRNLVPEEIRNTASLFGLAVIIILLYRSHEEEH